jgi:hypothetical protein
MRYRHLILLAISLDLIAIGASAQTGSIQLKPAPHALSDLAGRSEASAKRVSAAGAPTLGYVAGANPAELRAILGRSNAAQMGEPLASPENTKHLYLPPRQFYALVEKTSDEPLAIWALHAAGAGKQTETAIAGAMPHPDSVSFSPRGNVSVLYSQASGSLQVVDHLPAEPVISRQLSLAGVGTPLHIAISDDAQLLAAAFADGRMMLSVSGAGWRALPMVFMANAWSFLPNTHDLAISDTAQETIALLPKAEDPASSFHILALNMRADSLAVTRDGGELVTADLAAKKIWTIELKDGTVTERAAAANLETLFPLRDGFTFLLSTSPTVSVLRLSGTPGPADNANLALTPSITN